MNVSGFDLDSFKTNFPRLAAEKRVITLKGEFTKLCDRMQELSAIDANRLLMFLLARNADTSILKEDDTLKRSLETIIRKLTAKVSSESESVQALHRASLLAEALEGFINVVPERIGANVDNRRLFNRLIERIERAKGKLVRRISLALRSAKT